jgi:hypothetical protein
MSQPRLINHYSIGIQQDIHLIPISLVKKDLEQSDHRHSHRQRDQKSEANAYIKVAQVKPK